MVMGTSRIFRSTDPSAPPGISRTAGSLNNVLKAVLVDGYGATESLGWTLEFEEANTCVYRMKGGTRMYCRVNDGLTDYWLSEFSFFKTMSSADLGMERIPPPLTYSYLQKQYGTATVDIPWIIMGDDAGIYILHLPWLPNYPTYNSVFCFYWKLYYFGDYVPFDTRNSWNFCFVLDPYTANTSIRGCAFQMGGVDNANYSRWALRDPYFNKGSVPLGVAGMSGTYYGNNFLTNGAYGYPGFTGFGSRLRLYSSNPTNVLGTFPGLLDPWMIPDATYNTTTSQPAIIQSTDQEGNTSLYIPLLYNNSNVISTNIHHLVFRVGKGFRNV